MKTPIRTLTLTLLGAAALCVATGNAWAQRPSIAALQAQVTALQANNVPGLASYLSVDTSTPGRPVVRVSAANFQVVNGLGLTGTTNGVGNVIVGYDEARVGSPLCSQGQYTDEPGCTGAGGTWAASFKSGSHNVVVGRQHAYSWYGGLVAGALNVINGQESSVLGGATNVAAGAYATVSGGQLNQATGVGASVSGGLNGQASAFGASVSGGGSNVASGFESSVSGGNGVSAASDYQWVGGTLHSP